jgi:uncharacterized membrane protein
MCGKALTGLKPHVFDFVMESLFLLFGIVVIGGWVLGVVGFFKALTARSEIAALRRQLAMQRAGSVPEFIPEAAPEVVPEPVAAAIEAVVIPAEEPGAEEPPAPQPVPARRRPDLETLLTQRWGMWLGAVALVFAGVFLVRYAVDEGWLGPAVRCALAALLGVVLLAAAEWLCRRPVVAASGAHIADQAPSALAAGGIATLFGAAYGIGPLYDLVPPLAGFVLMAAAGLAGLAASLRFGPLAAAVGVAVSFGTPALVVTAIPSAPGLFGYLLVVTAASQAVMRFTAWTWLGWTATAAGAAWVLLFIVDPFSASEAWAPGLFVPAAAALHLGLLPGAALEHTVGRRLAWVPLAVLGAVGLALECTVADASVRAGVFLLAPIAIAVGAREPRLDRLPWLGGLFTLLGLLAWALPDWQPTGEAITIEGVVRAVLPGDWAPAVIRPLLETALVMAALHAAAGLLLERRATHPLRWAGLAAAMPVLILAATYAQVARFQTDTLWAFVALALVAGLVGAAWLARREGSTQRAGVHAAGAVAALALAFAMLLHDQWLTLAVALFLPPLAWIEAAADLPPLRRVALAVAALVLVRLLLNWYVFDYDYGHWLVVNGLVLAYALPAASFAVAAVMFRRRADDLPVAVLEAGAVAFFGVFVALEIRHGWMAGTLTGDASLMEATLHEAALAVQAVAALAIASRTGRPVLLWAARILGGLALAGLALLIAFNPAFTGEDADQTALVAGYLVPAIAAGLALRHTEVRRPPWLLPAAALLGGFAWIGLAIRIGTHPTDPALSDEAVGAAEMWAYSGAWLVYGAALMGVGLWRNLRSLRLAALGVIGLVAAKAFLLDMAGLEGLWRVLSFLGLGLVLIALGAAVRRFVTKPG